MNLETRGCWERDGPLHKPMTAAEWKEEEWLGGREMDRYMEDMLDKQVGVGGSAVRSDSLSFICCGFGAVRVRARDHPGGG